MSDLALDEITGDIALTGTHQASLTTTFEQEATQRLRMRMRRFLGEWFLDTGLGIPYRRDILVKNPDLQVIRSIFVQELLKDAAVDAVVSMNLELVDRRLQGTFVVGLVTQTELVLELGHTLLASDSGALLADDDGTDLVP